jgi:hypothetical protein
MKKESRQMKLTLHRETLRALEEKEMKKADGGATLRCGTGQCGTDPCTDTEVTICRC